MTDVAAELERLAALRDRGVLTAEEFEQQKAELLHPTPAAVSPTPSYAPYVPPAGTGTNKTGMIAGGVIALLITVGAALWATGILAKMGIGSAPFGGSTAITASSSPFGASATPAVNPFGAPATAPIAAPTEAPPATADARAADGSNPVLGTWAGQNNTSPSCPQSVTFEPNRFVMGSPTDPSSHVGAVTYQVQDANTVVMNGAEGEVMSITIHVTGDQMVLDDCNFTRSS